MKYFLLLSLIILPALSTGRYDESNPSNAAHLLCKKNLVMVTEITHEDYQIKISSAGDQICRRIDIFKNGELVYHDEEIGGYFYLGDNFEEGKGLNSFLNLPDRRNVNLVISKWNGGMHCCYSLLIFNLGQRFEVVTHLEGGNSYPYFEDINGDNIPEIKVVDDFLAYRFSSFAFSATAEIVLEYRDGSYKIAPEYMKKPAPDFQILDKKISSWKKEFRSRDTGDYPPPAFVQTITDLFYTGNKNLAMDVIDRTWPVDIPGRTDFIREYETALQESQFYKDFEQQVY